MKYRNIHTKDQFSKNRPTVTGCNLNCTDKLSEFSGICRFCAVLLNQINIILMFSPFSFKPLKKTYMKVKFFSIISYRWAQTEYNYYIYFLLEKKVRKSKDHQTKSNFITSTKEFRHPRNPQIFNFSIHVALDSFCYTSNKICWDKSWWRKVFCI